MKPLSCFKLALIGGELDDVRFKSFNLTLLEDKEVEQDNNSFTYSFYIPCSNLEKMAFLKNIKLVDEPFKRKFLLIESEKNFNDLITILDILIKYDCYVGERCISKKEFLKLSRNYFQELEKGKNVSYML